MEKLIHSFLLFLALLGILLTRCAFLNNAYFDVVHISIEYDLVNKLNYR